MTTRPLKIRTRYDGIYQKSLITPDFEFYINDNDGLMMFFIDEPNSSPMTGEFAQIELEDCVLENKWTWASEDMKYIIECILEEARRNEDS